MTIEESTVVDGVGVSKTDGRAVLTISDHLDWSDQQRHFDLFEKKISAYLTFIRSGQLSDLLPEAQQKPVTIELIYKFAPVGYAERFFEAARTQLDEMGIGFIYRGLPLR